MSLKVECSMFDITKGHKLQGKNHFENDRRGIPIPCCVGN